VQISDESSDLIFTDPPYLREHLHLYDWLAREASRMLKPGGFLKSILAFVKGQGKPRCNTFELDAEVAQQARQRVDMAQAPLPGLSGYQLSFEEIQGGVQ
jgi:predicted methyltransferase